MAEIDFFYDDGLVTVTNGSDLVNGQFTAWDPAVLPFDFFCANGGLNVIKEIVSPTQLRLAMPWQGTTQAGISYVITRWIKHTDPRIYGVRVSDYLTRLKAIPENITALAAAINADRQTVEAAMTTLVQIQTNVDDDRAAAQTARLNAQSAADAARIDALVIEGLLNMPLDYGNQAEPLGQSYDLGIQGT